MTSSLIYNRRLVWTMSQDTGMTIILLVILVIGGGALIFKIFGTPGFWLFLVFLFGPFLQYRFSEERRKLKLKADIEGSKLVGTDAYLAVLEKVDALGMKDMERLKRRRFSRYFSSRPSITERILNLREASNLVA